MEEIKTKKIDEVRWFFNKSHTALKLTKICEEAELSYQQVYPILNGSVQSMTIHVYDSLLPVMEKYGFKQKKGNETRSTESIQS